MARAASGPFGAGDILILVRTRGPFFDAVIRALKQKRVPVAGADRLQLTEHIAVLDLVAAGRAALLPEDDLNLAAVLKSPLIGLDDDDLLNIAPMRSGSLFEALNAASAAKFLQAGRPSTPGARARRKAPSPSIRAFFARMAGGARLRRGLDQRRPMRSTSFFASPLCMRRRRRLRSLAFSPISRRSSVPSSATWKAASTWCAS